MPHEQRVETLIDAFENQFARRPEGIAEAPGRVNLIGEHVDYNDGLVLPFAIDRGVLCAWRPSNDHFMTWFSLDSDEPPQIVDVSEFDEHMHTDVSGNWLDYGMGVAWSLHSAGQRAGGAWICVSGDVPQGAGLSSSAALEVAVAGALRDAFSLPVDDVELAQLCQRAENEYVGVQCGIMDQFASALSKRDNALLIDCRTRARDHVPLRLDEAGLSIVIANSGVTRGLASSAYNDRRRECEEAVALLRELLGRPDLSSLRDVAASDLVTLKIVGAPLRRARHVVTEIARVASAASALRSDDFYELGDLMDESHCSLQDDYAVSSRQLDLLVALASAQDYVLGARLTGAGFGGCTVNLVLSDAVEAFERDVITPYRERTGLPGELYLTSPQDGLRTWRL